METIKEAKSFLAKNYKTGVHCPCCSQFVKLYKRPLSSSMAYALILIKKHSDELGEDKFFHVENYLKDIPNLPASIRGDFPKLRFWGLILSSEEARADGSNRNGYYRLTTDGDLFVRGLVRVPSHVSLYNNKVLELSDQFIGVKDALGKKFNYRELMDGMA